MSETTAIQWVTEDLLNLSVNLSTRLCSKKCTFFLFPTNQRRRVYEHPTGLAHAERFTPARKTCSCPHSFASNCKGAHACMHAQSGGLAPLQTSRCGQRAPQGDRNLLGLYEEHVLSPATTTHQVRVAWALHVTDGGPMFVVVLFPCTAEAPCGYIWKCKKKISRNFACGKT